ncbi:MAG: phosphatidate cytidylyltransferase [Pseudomonadota bacterium]
MGAGTGFATEVMRQAVRVAGLYRREKFVRRVISAAILAPIAMYGAFLGGPAFAALVGVISIVMIFEWTRMTEGREFGPGFVALALSAVPAFIFAAAGAFGPAFAAAAAGGAATIIVGVKDASVQASGPYIMRLRRVWSAAGAIYVVAPCLALLWLRARPEDGLELVVMILVAIWATDTGAYVAGTLIGGPKLSPWASPKKTWAGLMGGLALASAACIALAAFWGASDAPRPLVHALTGACLAVVAQIGDVVESAVKRLFGIKDVSSLIPGHGGALDRLDGMIFATAATALVVAGAEFLSAAGLAL